MCELCTHTLGHSGTMGSVSFRVSMGGTRVHSGFPAQEVLSEDAADCGPGGSLAASKAEAALRRSR